jgi:hypothetical protein
VADVQRSVGGQLRSVLGQRQHPPVAPAQAAQALRRPAPPVFRPSTRASAASSGSGLTDAERARVPTIHAAPVAAPAVAAAPLSPAPKAVPAPKAAPRRPPPPIFARNTRSTQRT